MLQFLGTLAAVVVAFLLGLYSSGLARNKRLRGQWGSLRAESIECKFLAETYLSDGVTSPLYRLPLVIYQRSLGILLAEDAIEDHQARALLRFYGKVEEINRGLEHANEIRLRLPDPNSPNAMLSAEYSRNILKAETLLNELYKPALKVMDDELKKLTGKRWWWPW